MAEFITSDHFQDLIKPSFPLLDHVYNDQNLEEITQFSASTSTTTNTNTINTNNNSNNINVMDNSTLLNFQNFVQFSSGNFYPNPATTELMMISTNNMVHQNFPISENNNTKNVNSNDYCYSHESKKRKATLNFDASESSSGISDNGYKSKNGLKGKKVKHNKDIDEEKLKDVVHVRARRGQATDSHSLAERVRRGKINERLKCLQDIVPGCYKTMGMAVMLDEIINYVQSLQNQVEFLSMKLTAASSFYDFNSETDAMEKLQRAKANEAKEMERLIREGYGGFSCFHSNLPI